MMCCSNFLFMRLNQIGFLLLATLNLISLGCCENLLANADLEEDAFTSSKTGWFKRTCNATLSSDSYSGNNSALITGRKGKSSGLAQFVDLEVGKSYAFLAYLKLKNVAEGEQTASVTSTLTYRNKTTGKSHGERISRANYMLPNIWTRFGGDLTVLPGYDTMRLSIEIQSPDVDYYLDSTSLVEIPDLPSDWVTTANENIDKLRKADINIQVTSGNTSGVSVKLVQTKSEFPFGSCVSAERILDAATEYKPYQDFFYDLFTWATICNKLKWKGNEKTRDVLSYDLGVNALNNLTANGIKVRGHAVIWGGANNDPPWTRELKGEELLEEIDERIEDVTNRTYGKLEHWDVSNEDVHSNFYEEATGDVNLTMKVMQKVKEADPKPKLFLNDYAVINRPYDTQTYRMQAQIFKDTPGVPLYGCGIQSHLYPPIALKLIKHRLDQVAEVGLPIWITELDFAEPDENKKAELLENVMKIYFSSKAVEGIILWGYWDGKISKPEVALAHGPNCTANAAGRRLQKLLKEDWKTKVTVDLSSGSESVRGFMGDYSLQVTRDGEVIKEQDFVLGSDGTDISLTV